MTIATPGFATTATHTPALTSRLPNVGTTIFTVMSTLAAEKKAVNLGQGFPDFNCDPKLVADVTGAMAGGLNHHELASGEFTLRFIIPSSNSRGF